MTMSLLGSSADAAAAYQLGLQAAETDALQSEVIASVFGRRTQRVNVNAVLSQNQALAAENAELRAQLEGVRRELANYAYNYRELRTWADEVQGRWK